MLIEIHPRLPHSSLTSRLNISPVLRNNIKLKKINQVSKQVVGVVQVENRQARARYVSTIWGCTANIKGLSISTVITEKNMTKIFIPDKRTEDRRTKGRTERWTKRFIIIQLKGLVDHWNNILRKNVPQNTSLISNQIKSWTNSVP